MTTSKDFVKRGSVFIRRELHNADNIYKLVTFLFVIYSIITIVLYFAKEPIPDHIDVIINIISLSIPVVYLLYMLILKVRYKAHAIGPAPSFLTTRKQLPESTPVTPVTPVDAFNENNQTADRNTSLSSINVTIE